MIFGLHKVLESYGQSNFDIIIYHWYFSEWVKFFVANLQKIEQVQKNSLSLIECAYSIFN